MRNEGSIAMFCTLFGIFYTVIDDFDALIK